MPGPAAAEGFGVPDDPWPFPSQQAPMGCIKASHSP